MTLDYNRLTKFRFMPQLQSYTTRDSIFYALSVGLGADALDPRQLAFVYERDLRTFPTMVHVLAMDTAWLFDPANGIDIPRLLHVESGLTVWKPLPPAGLVTSTMAIEDIIDRGADKGAILRFRRDLLEGHTQERLATVTGTFLLRGNGGFGGTSRPTPQLTSVPERSPDIVCDIPTLPQAALLYRLNNDLNPLHADPAIARRAGFERPILHGACTYAVACHAIIRSLCGYDADRLRRFDVRFSAPVFPGEAIRTEMWEVGDGRFAFRSSAIERNVVVLNNGLAELTDTQRQP